MRQLSVLAAVVGAHLLLALLLVSGQLFGDGRRTSRAEPVTTLVLLDLESKVEKPVAKSPPPRSPPAVRPKPPERPLDVPPAETPGVPTDSTAITEGEGPGRRPRIDWEFEREITVQRMVPRLLRNVQRQCEEAERTGAPPPRGCARRSYDPATAPGTSP